MEIVLATRNRNKLREFRAMLDDLQVHVRSCDDFPDCPDAVEDGNSFAENALKKARLVASYTGLLAIADDSGLEVDTLGGKPGIYSARYGGVQGDDRGNIEKLLHELDGVPRERRGAQFRCVIAIVAPGGREQIVEGVCRGVIIEQPRGTGGFGYDPVFLDVPSCLTFAEMDEGHKNSISHRSRAVQELKKALPALINYKHDTE